MRRPRMLEWPRVALVLLCCFAAVVLSPQYSVGAIAGGDFEAPGGWDAGANGDPLYIGPKAETDCKKKNAKGMRLGKKDDTKGWRTSYVKSKPFDCDAGTSGNICVIQFWYSLTDDAAEEAHITTKVGVVTTTTNLPSTSGDWKRALITVAGCPDNMTIQFDLVRWGPGNVAQPLESKLCIDDVTSDCLGEIPEHDPTDPNTPEHLTWAGLQTPLPIKDTLGPGEITYDPYDCNGNGIYDGDDISGGTSEDLNGNGFPDECENYPSVMRMESTYNSLQGQYEHVSITTEDHWLEMGGFDFLIAYDYSALIFTSAAPGQLPDDCDWEYFTYHLSTAPPGLVRLTALAETNNGPYHPSCFGPPDGDPHELVEMTFWVSDDPTLECLYVPLKFFWFDCGDNVIFSVDGEDGYVSDRVYEFEGTDITDPTYGFPTYFGIQSDCYPGLPEEPTPVPQIHFVHGGVSISCGGCCGIYTGGITGNANCSTDGKLTLSDITRTIDRVYVSKESLCCEPNGNTNADAECKITLSDITVLIDAVYISKTPPAVCMPECE